jgi:hypothetical protein
MVRIQSLNKSESALCFVLNKMTHVSGSPTSLCAVSLILATCFVVRQRKSSQQSNPTDSDPVSYEFSADSLLSDSDKVSCIDSILSVKLTRNPCFVDGYPLRALGLFRDWNLTLLYVTPVESVFFLFGFAHPKRKNFGSATNYVIPSVVNMSMQSDLLSRTFLKKIDQKSF